MRVTGFAVGMSAVIFSAVELSAQSSQPAQGAAHVVVVRLVDRGGPTPYVFDPPVVNVERGDTVRFTEAANVMHNVRFTKEPRGAKLGAAEASPYLMKVG